MANFMFVYRNSVDDLSNPPSPEEMQQVMAKWGEWFQSLGDKIIDGGDALLPVGKQIAKDKTITDGPFIEAKELVGGYSIVKAESVDEACELAMGCPVLETGGQIEVRQLAGYSDSNG